MTQMPRIMIAAAHKSSGKTVITTGLAAAFPAVGTSVQSFKKGPDYIDPMWLAAASGRACYNLDFNTMQPDEMLALLQAKSSGADIALIEANKGLFDGVDLHGADSNAALAKLTQTPVVLVIDTNGMTRGIAPLLLGYQAFDPAVNIAGVILNKVGGARHEGKLRAAIEAYTDIAVIGAVGRNELLDIGERHLGLTTPTETEFLDAKIDQIAKGVGGAVDLEKLVQIAGHAVVLPPQTCTSITPKYDLKIAIPRDAAFGFYYPDDLEAFEAMGAKLMPFNALKNTQLPECDGVFLGGGFPEMRMKALSGNTALRADVQQKLQAGLPCYAECGGLMYLCDTMQWGDDTHEMCGVISADAVMCKRPQGRGYVRYESMADHPWGERAASVNAHEFHYAKLENISDNTVFARHILRGAGIDGSHDAIVVHNVLAGFCHQRNTGSNPWVSRFLDFVQKVKTQ